MRIQDMISDLEVNGWRLISVTKLKDSVEGVFSFGGDEEKHISENIDGLWIRLWNSVYDDYEEDEE